MEALNSFEERLISYGFKQGEEIGIKKEKSEAVKLLTNYLIKESNETLSFEKAKEKALKILNLD